MVIIQLLSTMKMSTEKVDENEQINRPLSAAPLLTLAAVDKGVTKQMVHSVIYLVSQLYCF